MAVRIVAYEFKVLEFKVVDFLHIRIDLHRREPPWLARELLPTLLQMIFIDVYVAEYVDKLPRLISRHLRNHHGEKCIGCDIKRHAEEKIRAPLIQ